MAGDMLCKGNGLSLGVTNGVNNGGLIASTGNGAYIFDNEYGKSVSTLLPSVGNNIQGVFGITTDSTKSGIIVDIDSLIILCSMIIKYNI